MKPKAFMAVSMMHALLKYAKQMGMLSVDSDQVSDIETIIKEDPETRLPVDQFNALWRKLTQQTSDPHFGLHFAETSKAQPNGDILTAVMFNCPTVGKAMEKLARYHHLTTDLIQIRIRARERSVAYAWESTIEELPYDQHISEAVICWIFSALKALGGENLSIVEVRFRHSKPMDTSEHQRIFNCPVVFDQPRDEIVVRCEDLDLPISLANPKLLERLEAIIQEQLDGLYTPETWSEQVSQEISKMLLRGQKPSIGKTAEVFAVSTRQLQNKLRDEGRTYRALLNQVRKEIALVYLKEPGISISDTALLLGFSDQSSFNHAFKRWTGSTPTKHRVS